MSARRALVLQHDPDAGPGLIGSWLAERSFDAEVVQVRERTALPGPSSYSLVVSLGSEHSADQDVAWLLNEQALLRDAHVAGTPLLGVCFGAQLLSRALGGLVRRAAVCEIGWRTVRSRRPSLVAAGPWFQWHFDTLQPPARAEIVATSEAGVEAFVWGRSLGVQFHPEVTSETVVDWTHTYRAELDAHGIAPARVLAEAAQDDGGAHRRAYELLDAFAARTGLTGPGRLASSP